MDRVRSALGRPGPATRVLLMLLAAAWAWPGAASADPALLSLPQAERPGEPVVVRVAFDLHDINQIDDEAETFEFDGVLTLEWHDARQAFDPEADGVDEKLYQGAFQFNEVFPGWFPQMVLVNEAGLFETNGVLLRVRPEGTLKLTQTLNAAAKTDLDLRPYPFDAHELEAVFEVLGFDESEVVLVSGLGNGLPPTSMSRGVRMPQWDLRSIGASVGRDDVPRAGAHGATSTFVIAIGVERDSLFMVRLVIIPLFLIVVLSWSVFWMDHSSVGDRVNISFIGILTVVAYQIVLSEILPRISYLTLMNGFLNMSFFIVCASVLVSLRVGWLDRSGRAEAGDRIDRWCRRYFPMLYVGLLGVVVALTLVVVSD